MTLEQIEYLESFGKYGYVGRTDLQIEIQVLFFEVNNLTNDYVFYETSLEERIKIQKKFEIFVKQLENREKTILRVVTNGTNERLNIAFNDLNFIEI